MRFPESFLDEIKIRLPLSVLIGRRLSWDQSKSQPRKGIFWACCPFHGEKTASFRVDDERGRYHCFGCKAGGDHFEWLMQRQNVEFAEAVSLAAQEAGVAMPQLSPEQARHEALRTSIFEINAAAQAFFAARLVDEAGAPARAYLEGRGIPASQWTDLGLGYAPAARSDLYKHLAALKFAEDAIIEAGLARDPVGSNLPADRFFGRLMFPIRDARGRVVGFGGRAMAADQEPKYLNTAETPAFSKSRILYNLDRAGDAARELNDLVMVEGYLDVAALERAGVRHVVAPMGTAITREQLELAWRYADEPCLCLDGDKAGVAATIRAMNEALPLLKPGRSLSFVKLAEGLDPDEILRTSGPDVLAAALKARRGLADILWESLVGGADVSTPERSARFQAEVIAAVAKIADDDVRKAYQGEMTDRVKAFWKEKGKKGATLAFEKKGADKPAADDAGSGGGGLPDWGPDELAAMNKRYAMVITGQRAAILLDSNEDLGSSIERVKFMNVDAFRLWLANRRARFGRTVANVADLWLADFHRRQYRGLEFTPCAPGRADGNPGFFNLWRGFVVEPKPNAALAQPWLDHVLENVAGGDLALYDWIVSWFAFIIQKPRERSNVSLVLRGGQGAGKTWTGKIIGSLFPANYFLVDDPRYLTGQFNAHLASCLFLQADEGFWAGDKQAEGRLKGLVTSQFQMIEYKGVDPVRLPNYVNMMISSNEDWVVPAGLRERRFTVIDVTPRRLQDISYFSKIDALYQRDDAKAALLYALATWKIDEAALRRVPSTEALFSQKVRSMDSFTGWLYELLLEGGLLPGSAWPEFVETKNLHDHFLRRAERLGHRHPLTIDGFGRKLRRMIPGVQRRQSASRKWCYLMPGLEVCRDDFCREVDFQVNWNGDGSLDEALKELGRPPSGDSGDDPVKDF